MKKENGIEREYREMMTQAAPDLWERIEDGLTDHTVKTVEEKVPRRRLYRVAAAMAAGVVILAAAPRFLEMNMTSGENTARTDAGAAAYDAGDGARETLAAMMPETTAGMALEQAAAGGAEDGLATMPETMALAEAAEETRTELTGGVAPGAGNSGAEGTSMSEEEKEVEEADPREAEEAAPEAEEGALEEENAALNGAEEGVLEEAAETASGETESLVQERTGAAAGDSAYGGNVSAGAYAEADLRDTRILCQVTIKKSDMADGPDGRPRIRYEAVVDDIFYVSDDINMREVNEGDIITIENPLSSTYDSQPEVLTMQPGQIYVIPLAMRDGALEPVFPDEPQIKENGDGGYLFPDVYESLRQEGIAIMASGADETQDKSAIRIYLRNDKAFIADLVRLIKVYTVSADD